MIAFVMSRRSRRMRRYDGTCSAVTLFRGKRARSWDRSATLPGVATSMVPGCAPRVVIFVASQSAAITTIGTTGSKSRTFSTSSSESTSAASRSTSTARYRRRRRCATARETSRTTSTAKPHPSAARATAPRTAVETIKTCSPSVSRPVLIVLEGAFVSRGWFSRNNQPMQCRCQSARKPGLPLQSGRMAAPRVREKRRRDGRRPDRTGVCAHDWDTPMDSPAEMCAIGTHRRRHPLREVRCGPVFTPKKRHFLESAGQAALLQRWREVCQIRTLSDIELA